MPKLRLFCIFSILTVLIAGVAWAQVVNGTLLGTVTDASGAVVANARVTALEQNTGISHVAETNESGNYVFPDMPPGTYTVTVELAGFKKDSILAGTLTRSWSNPCH
jgi:hypothetical protein